MDPELKAKVQKIINEKWKPKLEEEGEGEKESKSQKYLTETMTSDSAEEGEGEGEGEAKFQIYLNEQMKSDNGKEGEGEGEANMSWQEYLHERLMFDIEGTGNYLSSSAIISDGGKIMARSSNFPMLKPGEITQVRYNMKYFNPIRPMDMSLGDTNYSVFEGERGVVIHGSHGFSGVTVKKTCQGFVIGIYDKPVTPKQCSLVVETTGDHLIRYGK